MANMWNSFKEGAGQGLGQSVVWVPVCLIAYGAIGAPSWDEISQAFGRGYAAVTVSCVDQ